MKELSLLQRQAPLPGGWLEAEETPANVNRRLVMAGLHK